MTGVQVPAGVVPLQVWHMVESHAVLQQTCSSVQEPMAHSLAAPVQALPGAICFWHMPALQ